MSDVTVRIVQAGPASWVWLVHDAEAESGGLAKDRESAWRKAMKALRVVLVMRKIKALP